ncbi:MAG: DUF2723 domain-containing protein [Candidatus Daviesbacteria bacterium]|nr:DUF2723 domain-containing protein [Candidatus Daviesbacteria bacterium]
MNLANEQIRGFTAKILKSVRKHLPILLLVIAVVILRILYLSPYLEDWDSAQFALAMHHFSLISELPHAPGYPIYILLGNFLKIFFLSDNLSLTMFSAITGAATVLIVYLLAQKMFNKLIAFGAATIFAFIPVAWSLSEQALTNVPGLFFLSLLSFLLYKFVDNQKIIILISFLFGLLLGLRFTELPIIMAILLLTFIRQRNLKLVFFSFLSFIVGIFFWLGPLIMVTGWTDFIKAYFKIASYIFNHDSLLGGNHYGFYLIRLRLNDLFYILKIAYGLIFILISTAALVSIILQKKLIQEFRIQFLLVWFLAYLIPLVFFFNLEVTRYTLPLTVPLAILTAVFLNRFITNKLFYSTIIFIICIILFKNSYYQVNQFKNSLPPIIAPVLFVKNGFNPQETLIIPTLLKRHFQYYAPQFPLIDMDKINYSTISSKFVIIDHLSTIDQIPNLKNYNVKEKKEFFADKEIFNRVSSTTIYILERK